MNVARTSASPALRVAGGGDIVNASVDAKGVPSLGLACKGEALSRRGACVVCAYDSQADAWLEIADALCACLEAKVLCAERLGSASDRDHWVSSYAACLAARGEFIPSRHPPWPIPPRPGPVA